MKKLLISVLILLLLILTYFSLSTGVDFLNIKGLKSVKAANDDLEKKLNEAKEISAVTYPSEVEGIDEAIKKLKISKQDYDNKTANSKKQDSIGTVQVKTYKIHYLWTILGNYRKDRGVKSLNLDLVSTQSEDVYDLQFTLNGAYTSITDFIYDIENDEELNFEIKDFQISSGILPSTSTEKTDSETDTNNSNNVLDNSQNSDNNSSDTQQQNSNSNTNTNNTQSTGTGDGITLQAKFTVENVGITLD